MILSEIIFWVVLVALAIIILSIMALLINLLSKIPVIGDYFLEDEYHVDGPLAMVMAPIRWLLHIALIAPRLVFLQFLCVCPAGQHPATYEWLPA